MGGREGGERGRERGREGRDLPDSGDLLSTASGGIAHRN